MEGEFVNCDFWNGDTVYSVKELKQILTQIEKKFGKKAKIRMEAGHNNIFIEIQPSKKT